MTGKQILTELFVTTSIRLEDNGEYIGVTSTGEVTLGHTDNLESLYAYLVDFPTPDKW